MITCISCVEERIRGVSDEHGWAGDLSINRGPIYVVKEKLKDYRSLLRMA
jgi:hypothetical protein